MNDQTAIRAIPLLVTGCYRSGTTVVEKVLNQHPDLAVASQPFPVLYALAKQRFLAERTLERRYPLGHLFLESGYTSSEFHSFLGRYELTTSDLGQFFDQMDQYHEGLWTPEVREARDGVEAGTFWEVYQQLMSFLRERFVPGNVTYQGTKEVLVEEYAPYFLMQGAAVIIVVRDPRAMIASLNYREQDNLTGANRPVLFSLRAWRKSIAIAIALLGARNALLVRYEELALEPAKTLEAISNALGISPFGQEVQDGEIIDQYGQPWGGNSSFGTRSGISTRSVDAWRRKLPREVLEYIETTCMPEMRLLGYAPEVCREFNPDVLRNFRDPFSGIHARFPTEYSHDPGRIDDEIRRIQALDAELDPPEQRRWFLHEKAYHLLRTGGTMPSLLTMAGPTGQKPQS